MRVVGPDHPSRACRGKEKKVYKGSQWREVTERDGVEGKVSVG